MQLKDMRAGLRVIINSQAEGGTKDYINRVGTLSRVSQDLWVVVFDLIDGDRYTRSSVVLPHEINVVKERSTQ